MPDPSSARRTLLLNGTWELEPSDGPAPPDRWSRRVQVPALVDCAVPPTSWRDARFHWYRTVFRPPSASALAFLVVEQAMFGTEVWLNGIHLGGDIACYTSQEYDVRQALRDGGPQELIIRVGHKQDLPAHSAVGADQERSDWIPGIWGDVRLVQSGNPRIRTVFVLPQIDRSCAEVRLRLENLEREDVDATVITTVREKISRRVRGGGTPLRIRLPAGETGTAVECGIEGLHLWSPDDPFLYELETLLDPGGGVSDATTTVFGMREFRIAGREFLLNGKPIRLRGGNIAFHRFLSDPDRRLLPWDPGWIRTLLIDIPKTHNFNFFRNHLGQMYNRWYDIADAHGMLLQNEWMFWTTTGSRDQIIREFTRWLEDNGNHPSIVLWDPLNESSDPVVQDDIVPLMKQRDPTRPWESVDVREEHPYIYSLGPVLNDRAFGFTRSLEEIARTSAPTMLNEFCWWWLDRDFQPSSLTREVVERWLGPDWTQEALVAHQSFLMTELVELFRRMRVNAIQPFVYLSNNAGPTGDWFAGDIGTLTPKPVLAALRNAFAPLGVSVELWDRHFEVREQRTVRLFVFNDHDRPDRGEVVCSILDARNATVFETVRTVEIGPSGCVQVPVILPFPPHPGRCTIRAEVRWEGKVLAFSEKEAHVFPILEPPQALRARRVVVLAADGELPRFLTEAGMEVVPLEDAGPGLAPLVVIGEGMLRAPAYQSRVDSIGACVIAGGRLVVIEPEYGVDGKEECAVLPDILVTMERREDRDRGGYDSYVFAEDPRHPLWAGLEPAHLRMFNGGYGGEVVSEHRLDTHAPHEVLARCGLKLSVPAVFGMRSGRGSVLVSRLQLRGRLRRSGAEDTLFARRPDPVLRRFLLNCLRMEKNP